jgi:hypothetical protein
MQKTRCKKPDEKTNIKKSVGVSTWYSVITILRISSDKHIYFNALKKENLNIVITLYQVETPTDNAKTQSARD